MFSGSEWVWIVIIALVLFGGSQIPKLARNLGQAQSEFKKGLANPDGDDSDASSDKTDSEKSNNSEKSNKE